MNHLTCRLVFFGPAVSWLRIRQWVTVCFSIIFPLVATIQAHGQTPLVLAPTSPETALRDSFSQTGCQLNSISLIYNLGPNRHGHGGWIKLEEDDWSPNLTKLATPGTSKLKVYVGEMPTGGVTYGYTYHAYHDWMKITGPLYGDDGFELTFRQNDSNGQPVENDETIFLKVRVSSPGPNLVLVTEEFSLDRLGNKAIGAFAGDKGKQIKTHHSLYICTHDEKTHCNTWELGRNLKDPTDITTAEVRDILTWSKFSPSDPDLWPKTRTKTRLIKSGDGTLQSSETATFRKYSKHSEPEIIRWEHWDPSMPTTQRLIRQWDYYSDVSEWSWNYLKMKWYISETGYWEYYIFPKPATGNTICMTTRPNAFRIVRFAPIPESPDMKSMNIQPPSRKKRMPVVP